MRDYLYGVSSFRFKASFAYIAHQMKHSRWRGLVGLTHELLKREAWPMSTKHKGRVSDVYGLKIRGDNDPGAFDMLGSNEDDDPDPDLV